jgi:hypothetical protein
LNLKNRKKRKVLGIDELKSIYGLSREASSAGKGSCPPLEKILESFFPGVSENEKFRVVDHAAACPSCHQKFEMARGILLETKRMAEGFEEISLDDKALAAIREKARLRIQELERSKGKPATEGGKEPLRGLLAVRNLRFATAAVLLLVGGLFLISILTLRQRPQETVRGTESQGIRLEVPQGEWAESRLTFHWVAYPGAEAYEVKLLDEALTMLWMSGRTKIPYAAFPPGRLASLEKGKTYYWKVIVHLKKGKVIESGLQEFRLRPL